MDRNFRILRKFLLEFYVFIFLIAFSIGIFEFTVINFFGDTSITFIFSKSDIFFNFISVQIMSLCVIKPTSFPSLTIGNPTNLFLSIFLAQSNKFASGLIVMGFLVIKSHTNIFFIILLRC